MRTMLLLVLLLACKKDKPQGLPPANDWSAQGGGSAAPASPPGGSEMPPGHPAVSDQLPPDHPATGDQGGVPSAHAMQEKTLTKQPDGRFVLGPYAVAVPSGWTEVATKSDMRAAQFKIGAGAELVVYYFGNQGAGSVQDNIDRWLGQFTQANGKPSKEVAKTEKLKILGFDATIVSVSGRYQASAMPGGGEAVDKADQSLLAAITDSSAGPYYWKLVGDKATVAANTTKFRTMLTTLQLTK